MERASYYSMIPIIVVHAIYYVGLPVELGLILTIFMYPFQYGLPIFTGALAEKVGYKKQIIVAFTILTAAYFFLAFAFDTITMIFAVIAVGIGIGTYKPLISSTVAKCTPDKDRNLAYSIYYWIVNLAAFLIPLCFAIIMAVHIIVQETYYIVFIVGGFLVAVNVFTAISVFEEVPRSGKVKTVRDALSNIKIAMSDKKFVVMVMLIGGFWALYSTFLNALPLIMFGFDFLPGWFSVMLLGVFNPGTIILLGIPLAKFIEKVESMRVVLTGIMVYLVGMAVIGYSLQWEIVIVGIIIASIGEFIVAPGYMAFVSKLAQKEKVSAYVGCNFISYMVGLLGGTFVFGTIAAVVATQMEMPHFFYGIVMAVGLGLLILFILYYWTWGQDIIERARKIRELEEGTSEEKDEISEDKDYVEPFIFKVFDSKLSVLVCLILIPIVLTTTYGMPTYTFNDPIDDDEVPPIKYIQVIESYIESGYTNEQQTSEVIVTIEQNRLAWLNCTLTWQDEPNSNFRYTNEPDFFNIIINAPGGDSWSTSSESDGSVSVSVPVDYTMDGYGEAFKGDWTIIVEAGNCGDQTLIRPSLGLQDISDDGNLWDLEYDYTYFEPEIRKQGIGNRLLRIMIDILKQNNISKMTLQVSVDNEIAINFYLNAGFKILKILPNYYPSTDGYQMERVIR
jgi:MFS family permease/GNAT superfamily N-acetyltransferase